MSNITQEEIKDLLEILQNLFTIAAVSIGGLWGYRLFRLERKSYTRANISYKITTKKIYKSLLLLHINLIITNHGTTLLKINSGEIRIQWMLPIVPEIKECILNAHRNHDTEVTWPLIDSYEFDFNKIPIKIEPGENEEIHCDFLLSKELSVVQTVRIYSFFTDKSDNLGWNKIEIYDIN